MSGKLVALVLLLAALLGGGGLYYLQVYGFYHDVPATEGADVLLVARDSEERHPIEYTEFRAIDADSSPIRYRACFKTDARPEELQQRFEPLTGEVVPRNAPGWFDCFDASRLGAALKAGTAQAFLSAKNIRYGVDRIVAITQDGRGYVWHELNECGTKAYDGTVVGERCPPRPATR